MTGESSSFPRPLTCVLLSVGDELASGLTIDTNSAWLSRRLSAVGVRVVAHATVGDDQLTIERAVRDAAATADLLVITGGIGPTPDDLTREALASVMGAGLIEDPGWIAQMEQMFRERGREMKPGNRKQAGVPAGADLLWNPVGTAAGIAARVGRCTIFSVPGVPKEMEAMFEQHVAPWAREQAALRGGQVLVTRAIHTFGIGESDLAARLNDLLRRGPEGADVQVGTTASRGIVSVRAYTRAAAPAEAAAALDVIEDQVRAQLGDLVFGIDDETLAESVGRLLQGDSRSPIVSTAESCTGGLIAKLLTDVPGSSDYFHRGYVTYSNAAKRDLLGVPESILSEHGAVSGPTVEAMASGAREAAGYGIALAVSGVAGPGGGTHQKPVGTVWIALASPDGVDARRFVFPGDRETVRLRSAYMALMLLRFHLLGHGPADLPL